MLCKSLRLLPVLICALGPLRAQSPATTDPLAALDFLTGSWSAKTGGGSAGAAGMGTYSFHRDLAGHVLSRNSSLDRCNGPQSFDCQHHDQLTIFPDPGNPHDNGLSALYVDSEGHVIHYAVTLPSPHTVVLQSIPIPGATSFRLTYHLDGEGPQAVMTGSFAGAPPGSGAYHPYLEWSGTRQ